MADSQLRYGSDYDASYDPKAHLTLFSAENGFNDMLGCAMEGLHQIYSEGKVKGNRFIDIGTGPTIHFLIPAAKWFNEIYISDFSVKNIETQKKWLARDPESFDWQDYFRYFAEKDGKAESWPQYEQNLRDKVKGVLACDFNQPNPLHPETMGQFDAVSTSLALETGSKNLDQFKTAMKNIVSLIAPGGYFIIYTILKCPYYTIGDEKFWCLNLTHESVLESVKETNLEVVKSFRYDCKCEAVVAPYDGTVMILGRKKTDS